TSPLYWRSKRRILPTGLSTTGHPTRCDSIFGGEQLLRPICGTPVGRPSCILLIARRSSLKGTGPIYIGQLTPLATPSISCSRQRVMQVLPSGSFRKHYYHQTILVLELST